MGCLASRWLCGWFALLLLLGVSAIAQTPRALDWDAITKESTLKPGETNLHFTFYFTNVYGQKVVIQEVTTSCGCTVAKLPQVPWELAPGTNGQVDVFFDARGKWGTITKPVFVHTSRGMTVLTVVAKLASQPPVQLNRPPPVPGFRAPMLNVTNDVSRDKNMELAKGDRQAVFKGACANCHSDPAFAKSGPPLYQAACGICHDSPQRAQMVPDLHHLNHPTGVDYWRQWIAHGKEGTLMPAFAKPDGGPLDAVQIESLVAFLNQSFIPKPVAAPVTK